MLLFKKKSKSLFLKERPEQMMRANRSPCSFKKSDKSEDESESHSSLFTKRAKKQFTLLKRGEERFALFCKKKQEINRKTKAQL